MLELRIDVTGAASLPGRTEMAVSVSLPTRAALPERPVVMFCAPGGWYGRGYFDLQLPGHAGYSQAEHHVERGVIVVALDHVGVGDSSLPDPELITFEVMAATFDRVVGEICARLRSGDIDPRFGPLPNFATVGLGQSMGGCAVILTQGRHATFDAIAPLGFSAIQTVVPQPPGAPPAPANFAERDLRWPFHFDDVPVDIVEADLGGGYPVRETCPPWGSRTVPGCGKLMMAPGAVAAEAAAVTVPVFIGNGERDVCPTPREEPAAYAASDDILVRIYPRMAHMHNFASSRRALWDDLVDWSAKVARLQP